MRDLKFKNIKFSNVKSSVLFIFVCCLLTHVSFSQVITSIDSTSIEIGEQITFKVQVEIDSLKLVVFPEGQTFEPLEMIESYKVDTIKNKDKYNFIKKYGLTQFDSGSYTLPQQKIIIGNKTFLTDSLKVEVRDVIIDSTKQAIYDIKPIIEVNEIKNSWWKNIVYTLLIIGVIAGLLWWFFWRKRELTEEEKIALLPPYDRAKLALKKLDESTYLEHENLKDYYSELTFIIRKYLDEKVYDRALESTTEELISRLNLLKKGNQIDLSKEDIKNLENILKRADLVKFAKSAPDVELAKIDRNIIDIGIDHVKAALPEPTEEEKLLDEKYKKELERKKRKQRVVIAVVTSLCLLLLTLIGFTVKYGFNYLKDNITGHDTLELLETDWITSDYGFPPITISTPKVLKRMEASVPDEVKSQIKITAFGFEQKNNFSIALTTTTLAQAQDSLDITRAIDGNLKTLENRGARNIFTKNEKFITPNGSEGVKTFGTLDYPVENTEHFIKGEYVLLSFTNNQNVVQQIVLSYVEDDVYADKIIERILNSVELKKEEE